MAENSIIEEIKPFLDACDKMVASKFIMIDKRISDVLKTIVTIKPVFDLVKECMINFSFEREWSKATAKVGQLMPPEDGRKFIAFVFSLLNNIDSKRLNASEVLSRYFSKVEANQSPYGKFCDDIIMNFKNVVVEGLVGKSPEKKSEMKAVSVSKEVLARLEFLAKDLKDYVQGLKKLKKSELTKGELLEVISGLILAIRNGHTNYIKPFIMAIKAGKGKDKEIERRLVEIMDISSRTLIDA